MAEMLSIVIPSYFEAENLRLVIPRIKTAVAHIAIPTEILIVDTATPMDETSLVCNEHQVRYVPRKTTNSFGDAIRTGILEAKGDWILFMDGDGSHPPEMIPTLWEKSPNCDVVIGSRYVDGGRTENSWHLILMSRILNWTYAYVLNLRVSDVSNNFKLYRASLLKALHLKCSHFDIIEEILFKLQRQNPGLRMIEVPCMFKKRLFGETKRNIFLFMFAFIFTMLRLRFWSIRGELTKSA